jgi:hypothetical protein
VTPPGVGTGRDTDLVEVVNRETRNAAVQRVERERFASGTRPEQ